MSDMKELFKRKIRSSRESVHSQLIDPINSEVDLLQEHLLRPKRKFEDQYTRQTYYIHNDLLHKINSIAKKEKGEKTRIINQALSAYLSKYQP